MVVGSHGRLLDMVEPFGGAVELIKRNISKATCPLEKPNNMPKITRAPNIKTQYVADCQLASQGYI